jgi:non-ribosomal peptide synthase protein (TIGR01720 family)
LGRAVLLDAGDAQPKRLLLVIHHLVVDGVSWRVLLEDLDRAYTQLSSGAEVDLGRKTDSFKLWAENLRQYAQSDSLMREAGYWLAVSESRGASPRKEYPEGANTVGSARRVTAELGPAETRALLQEVPAAYHTQINEVLLTALLLAHRRWSGEHALLIDLEGHGREEGAVNLSLSRTVGWFTSVFPVLLRAAEGTPLPEVLKGVKEQLRNVPNRGFGFGVLRHCGPGEVAARLRALPRAEVSFNYLGQMDQTLQESSWCRVLGESVGLRQSPQERRRYLIEVTASLADGRLRFDWEYSENVHPRSAIERFAGHFGDSLRELITHCQSPEAGGFTPSDFPLAKLDRHKLSRLDALLNKKAR